jgi:hypothetical protein
MGGTSPGSRPILTILTAGGPEAARVAEATTTTLLAIDAELSPIISERGVAALYRRSLFLIRQDRPWLDPVYAMDAVPGDYEALRNALAQQDDAGALDGAHALLRTLHELLASLIGESLTERLLGRILEKTPSSGGAVQDFSP